MSKKKATVIPNQVLRTLLSKQIHLDFSKLTREEQEQAFLSQSKNALSIKLGLLKEEKQKELQNQEEQEAREAAIKEKSELEKIQATQEAKMREERHPISQAIKRENCVFFLLTVDNINVLRYAEYSGYLPLCKSAYEQVQQKRQLQL